MKIINFILTGSTTILLCCLLSGYISIPSVPLPPLAKFLHPINGIWNNGESINSTNSTEYLSNISATSSVKYDERMVPHIEAENLAQALYLQGYTEASNRLFQMDLITRAASGRLSEIFGERTLAADKSQNRKDLELAAKNSLTAWENDMEAYELFGNYINGVNDYIAYLEYKYYPIEFKLLNYKPEPWSYYKSALVGKYMANTLARRESDVESTNMLVLLGREMFDHLFPEGENGGYPVVPEGYDYGSNLKGDPEDRDSLALTILKKQYFEKSPKGIGSNNWVIGSSKSATGHPIFCNDPHLALTLPSIWFELQITTPDINAYGVSIPGLPSIFMGFNESIAWGETNVGHDVADMFLIKYTDKDKKQYWLDGKKKAVTYDIQEIKIKGKPSVYDTLRYTEWGLILRESNDGLHDVAVKWLAVAPTSVPEINTFIKILSCSDYNCFKKGSENFMTPAQNFLFGAKNGDIGLRVNGLLPAKFNEDGRFLESGDQSSNGWNAFIDRNQNPQAFNPPQDYLTSSNQRSASKDYPYYYTGTFEHYRNRIINRYLSKDTVFTVDEMKAMQGDSYSILAEELLPILLSKVGAADDITTELKNWDYRYTKDSKAPVYFNIWLDYLKKEIFDEIYLYSDSMDIMIPEDQRIVSLILEDCEDRIFDKQYTNDLETCTHIINMAFDLMKKEVATQNGINNWAEYKPVDIMHYARIPAFSRQGIRSDGFGDAINASGSGFGPSWRMVVKLGDQVEAFGVYPGGQSGNPASKYYDNMIADWADNKHQKLNYLTREQLKSMNPILSLKSKS